MDLLVDNCKSISDEDDSEEQVLTKKTNQLDEDNPRSTSEVPALTLVNYLQSAIPTNNNNQQVDEIDVQTKQDCGPSDMPLPQDLPELFPLLGNITAQGAFKNTLAIEVPFKEPEKRPCVSKFGPTLTLFNILPDW